MSQKKQKQENPEARLKREKKERRSTVLSYLIIILAVIFYADFLMLDSLIYGFSGFIDAIFGTSLLPSVKGGLGTLKFFGFGFVCFGGWYLSRQEV